MLRDRDALFGPVASMPTARRLLDRIDEARLPRVRAVRAAAWDRAWQAGALILIPSPGGRASLQHRLQLTQLGRGELAPGTPCPFRSQRRLATGGQRPPPPVHRHPRHPEPPGHLPVTGPRLD